MASPCEVLLEVAAAEVATRLTALVADEARRIERKFSRYRDDNIVHAINHSEGREIELDPETVQLLSFAAHCHEMSGGLFDITSGVLRKVWRFDGSDRIPNASEVANVHRHVGWNKLTWRAPWLTLPPGMELDFGGIGKEYAVDRAFARLARETSASFLINFGGDLRASGRRQSGEPWSVGVENPYAIDGNAVAAIRIAAGALATSGDSQRYLRAHGKRYSHILDPRTGWPVEDAPRSVTVAAPTAIEAGMLATMACLQGAGAEGFLTAQDVRHWVLR
ncbi:MAG: FAD:protein FMN transferase [Thiotrichales bacterium]